MFMSPGRVEPILCLPLHLPTGSPPLNREKNNPVPRPAPTLSGIDPRHHVLTRQFIRSVTFTSARLVSSLVTLVGSCMFLHRFLIVRHHSHQSYRYLLEHGLTPDGHFKEELADDQTTKGSYDTFFTETPGGKYVPRSIFVDLDPSVCWPASECNHISNSLDMYSPSMRSVLVPTASFSTPSS